MMVSIAPVETSKHHSIPQEAKKSGSVSLTIGNRLRFCA